MKSNDIDQLLSGLLGNSISSPKTQEAPPQPSRSSASEEARRRVEEIMRSVELEANRSQTQEKPKQAVQTIPKREPVTIPEPVSHFSDGPSQIPAVRMHERLDEVSLPMIDTERKPTQIIPPKPKPETEKPHKKRRKKTVSDADKTKTFRAAEKTPVNVQTEQRDLPKPAEPPKRKIPHIVVPDEFPPDPMAQPEQAQPELREEPKPTEPPKRKIVHIEVPDEFPPDPMAQPVQEQPEQREEPKPAEPPKRKILHIEVPDEFPPDPMAQEEPEKAAAEPETAEEQKAEEILSSQPAVLDIAPPASFEELMGLDEELPDLSEDNVEASAEPEHSAVLDENENAPEIVLPEAPAADVPAQDVAEAAPLQKETAADEPRETAEPANRSDDAQNSVSEQEQPKLRHLSMPAEKPQKEQGGFLGLFSRKKKLKAADISEETASEEQPEEMPEDPEKAATEVTADTAEDAAAAQEKVPALQEIQVTEKQLAELSDIPETVEENEPDVQPEKEIHEQGKAAEEAAAADAAEQEAAPAVEIDVTLPGETAKNDKKKDFMKAIRAALDESAEELAEIKAEPVPEQSAIDVKVGRARFWRRNRYFVVGILCTIFAVIGLVACVMYGVRAVQHFAKGSSLSDELEKYLYPIAVVDMSPFEDAADANVEGMLSAAIIDMVMYGDVSAYPCSFDMLTIPAEDIRVRASEMFGMDLQPEYTTLRAAGELFFYDETAETYNVPVSPVIFSYAPEVQEIQLADNGDYVVTVAYHGDTAQWQQHAKNFEHDLDKTMEITMRKNGDDYQIVRIVNVSGNSGQGI